MEYPPVSIFRAAKLRIFDKKGHFTQGKSDPGFDTRAEEDILHEYQGRGGRLPPEIGAKSHFQHFWGTKT